MRLLQVFLILLFTSFSSSNAAPVENPPQNTSTTEPALTGFLLLQVVKDQFVLDNSTIKSASIVQQGNGKYVGLKVELKPYAIAELEKITTAGIGKPFNLVFNKKVLSTTMIQSALGGQLLISSLNKEQAQAFLKTLTQIEKRHIEAKQVERMPNN